MIKNVKNFSMLGSLNMIIAHRRTKGEHTPELAELLKDLISKSRRKKLKKITIPFVCDLGTLYELYKAEMIDINHPGNRKDVWDIDRALEFMASWIKDENRYDPTFALKISKSGKIDLCALDANNRTSTIIKCFMGDEDLHKFIGMLPKTFRGTLRIGYTDEENKNYTANCNNFKRQTDGEIMNVTPGRIVYEASKYVESSSGLYAKKGDVHQYVKISSERFRQLGFYVKCECYIDAVKYKGKEGLDKNIFDIRNNVMKGAIDSRAGVDNRFYHDHIQNAMPKIQSLNPNFKLAENHIAWALTMGMEMEKSIKNYNKFVTSLLLKIDEIVKINKKKEKSDRKKLLKTELSHIFGGERKTLIKFFKSDMRKDPKKYGLR